MLVCSVIAVFLNQCAVSLLCRVRDAEIAAQFDTYLRNYTYRFVICTDRVVRIEETATCKFRAGSAVKRATFYSGAFLENVRLETQGKEGRYN